MTNTLRKMDTVKRIAVIAHDHKKSELIDWSYINRQLLFPHEIIATGATADILEGTINKPVVRVLHGPLGIDQQVSAMIAEGMIDIIILFRSSGAQQIHESDMDSLIRIANAHDIAIAANRATADFIITSALLQLTHPSHVKNSTPKNLNSLHQA